MICGCIKSQLDGTEQKFTVSQDVPNEFRYKMPDVINQGVQPTCTACASSAFLTWQWNKDFNIKEIFKNSKPEKDGAELKNVFKYLQNQKLIDEYALIGSPDILKTAIILNGPCIGALPVYNDNPEFWIGNNLQGGHAIAIVGWDETGFIIRNSWGSTWNGDGYTVLPYDDFNKFMELWTLIK